jgi:hypothetical protein
LKNCPLSLKDCAACLPTGIPVNRPVQALKKEFPAHG